MNETFLVLGGGGMIGRQVVHEIARNLRPQWIIICSLYQKEVREAIEDFKREFPYVKFLGFWGDIFLRAEWNPGDRQRQITRAQLLDSAEHRDDLYEDLFGDADSAYERSQLVKLILEHRPAVVIDTVNTATGISYQDVYSASDDVRKRLDSLAAALKSDDENNAGKRESAGGEDQEKRDRLYDLFHASERSVEKLLISQSVPQLIRHVLLIHRAMSEAGTRLYLKVGTTGTGGMGLNIPYTHSEDKPSVTLMTKTAIAFAHTGLMFLMARTPKGPVVKEVKPGAMVGYANITCRKIRQKGKQGKPMHLFAARHEPLNETLTLRQSEGVYERKRALEVVVVDTGENGLFTKGEFEAITHMWQMEFITPEEIAEQIVLEVKGSNTGYDVIAAIDSAVMNPTYRAGYLRSHALEDVARLEATKGLPSVALGQLGPPELGKLLWEAHLLRLEYGTLEAVLEEETENNLAEKLFARVQEDEQLRDMIVSVGLPILAPKGDALLRGPFIRIPESPNENSVRLSPEFIEKWARKGWVDLRPCNMERWRRRFRQMQRETQKLRGRGSASLTREAYLYDEISIGSVVGWIFNNEEMGYRIK